MKIITIHGIRRKNKWYKTLAALDEIDNNKYEFVAFDYGYFHIGKFLTKRSIYNVVKKFQKFYSDHIDPNDPPPSVVCHSFGSYIWLTSIEKYPSIKFDRVLLCGTILNPEVNIVKYFKKKQIKQLRHEYGLEDGVVGFSKIVLGENAGNSGKEGFLNIPNKYKKFIEQEELSFEHSDYFLPIHMKTSWIPFLIGGKTFKFNTDILDTKILDRLYSNREVTNTESSHAIFSARIDVKGNYYARYLREGINTKNHDMRFYDIITSADAVHEFEEMQFMALDNNKNRLSVSVIDDSYQKKYVRVNFKDPIKQGSVFSFEYRFLWKSTIGLITGDTDFFWIRDCRHVSIYLNFPKELIAPRLYLVKDNSIVQELRICRRMENNKSVTYFLDFDNKDQNDGIIFYFDGQDNQINIEGVDYLSAGVDIESKDSNIYTIERCKEEDIKEIYKIELTIERSNAATESILYERLNLFPEGFLVVKDSDNKIVGYLESVVLHDFKFCKFEEIYNFPLHFSPYGKTLYVIFIAVHPKCRGQYLGLELVKSIVEFARRYGADRVKLVAKDNRIGLYQKCGFDYIKELPAFLEGVSGKSIVMQYNLRS